MTTVTTPTENIRRDTPVGRTRVIGGIMIAMVAGLLFDYFKAAGDIRVGYGIMFMICSTAYIIAWFVMHLLVPKFKKIELE